MGIGTRKRIFVAGHRGMVGSAVCRLLEQRILGGQLGLGTGSEVLTASRSELDLTDSAATLAYFQKHRPDVVIFAAARVGGIVANKTYPVEFLSDNLLMAVSAIRAAHQTQVGRFLFLGSTCIYPRDCQQPIQEDSLLTGPLEPSNEAYALAKISGLKLCQYYRSQYGSMFHSAMPTNLYGPGDNYHPEHSHVLPALIRRFHEAKVSGKPSVTIWGTGSPRREFLYVEDLADALIHLCQLDDPPDWVNVGTGIDSTILETAQLVAKTVGYLGKIETDTSRPDGTPVKCTDVTRLHATRWKHQVSLADGLQRTYQSFLEETQSEKLRSV